MTTTLELQQRLAELGFKPGPLDGVPGSKTTAAIKMFQTSRALTPDGVVGPRTLAALFPTTTVGPGPASASMITAARVKAFAPSALPSLLDAFDYMQADTAAAGIVTPRRAQHFMAQIAVESAGLTRIEENLNYSAARLVAVWPKRFPTIAAAQPYAHNPEALANKVYGGRLGNTQPGDGWRYRGSGLMQNTGRLNFRAAGHEDDPQVLRTAGPALKSALQFWSDHNLNVAADADDVKLVRKIVNGGSNGLADARTWLAKARQIFV